MSKTYVTCSGCGTRHPIDPAHFGRVFTCPICREQFRAAVDPEEVGDLEPDDTEWRDRLEQWARKTVARPMHKATRPVADGTRLALYVLALLLPFIAAGFCDGPRGLLINLFLLLILGMAGGLGVFLAWGHAFWCVYAYCKGGVE